jgi:hypothetical protein
MSCIEDEHSLLDTLNSLEYDSGIRIVDSKGRTIFINKDITDNYIVMLRDPINGIDDVISVSSIEQVIKIIKIHLIKPYSLYLY